MQPSCVVLVIFSTFCEWGCGTSDGIVPFMGKEDRSGVAALVGAGGNLGAVIAAQCFYKQINDDLLPYQAHGGYVLFFALRTPVLAWPQHGGTGMAPKDRHAPRHPHRHTCISMNSSPWDVTCTQTPT